MSSAEVNQIRPLWAKKWTMSTCLNLTVQIWMFPNKLSAISAAHNSVTVSRLNVIHSNIHGKVKRHCEGGWRRTWYSISCYLASSKWKTLHLCYLAVASASWSELHPVRCEASQVTCPPKKEIHLEKSCFKLISLQLKNWGFFILFWIEQNAKCSVWGMGGVLRLLSFLLLL